MDLSSDPSQDEARVMERQLYRPGQSTPKTPATTSRSIAKTPLPATRKSPSPATDKAPSQRKRLLLMVMLLGFGYYLLYGTPQQRKRILIGLGVAAWLLMLGSISYCIFLPDLNDVAKERQALWQDPNLTDEQKFEKMRELDSQLTSSERRQLRELGMKERARKDNAEMHKFLQMSPEEQLEYARKDAEREKERRDRFMARFANRGGPGGGSGGAGSSGGAGGSGGPGGGRGGATGGGGAAGGGAAGGGGNAQANRSGGGPGGGGSGGGGPGAGGAGGGGGPGGGGRGSGQDRNVRSRIRLDFSSPEARAGRNYMRGISGR